MLTLRRYADKLLGTLAVAMVICLAPMVVRAADGKSDEKPTANAESKDAKPQAAGDGAAASSSGSSSSSSGEKEAPAKKPKYPPYAEVFRDADDPISGLIKMRRKGGTLYAEISPSQLDRDFIVVMSIARGIGRGSLLAGMSWNFGDDPVWQFRKVDDYIHVVRRNVRFKAEGAAPRKRP